MVCFLLVTLDVYSHSIQRVLHVTEKLTPSCSQFIALSSFATRGVSPTVATTRFSSELFT